MMKIKIKPFKQIEKTFAAENNRHLKGSGIYFAGTMQIYCGKTIKVTEIYNSATDGSFRFRAEDWNWPLEWIDFVGEDKKVINYLVKTMEMN